MLGLDVSGLLTEQEWSEGTLACIRAARHVVKQGRSPGSLEPKETAGLDYWVADGFAVAEAAEQFLRLYTNPTLVAALEERVGARLEFPPDKRSRVNVNVLTAGRRYEEHVDDWGVTAVVFLTDCEGGHLQVMEDGEWWGQAPRAGHLVVFDGSRVPHRVLEVQEGIRVTLLLEYLIEGREEVRSETLNAELYE